MHLNRNDEGIAASLSPRSQELLRAIRRIIQCIDIRSHQLMRRFGLTGPQLVVLQEISASEEPSAGELAHSISLSQATVAVILSRLESRGLVSRSRDPQDRRRVLVHATAAGRKLLRQAPPLLQESFLEEYQRLEEWEQTWILSSFQRVVSMMDATEVEAVPMLMTDSLGALDPPSARMPEDVKAASAGAPEN